MDFKLESSAVIDRIPFYSPAAANSIKILISIMAADGWHFSEIYLY
jgi:hypothetical protein